MWMESVQGKRIDVRECTLAGLGVSTRLCVLSGIDGSQTGPRLASEGCMHRWDMLGHWSVWIECIMMHSLKFTQWTMGSQWSCLKAGATCSLIHNLYIASPRFYSPLLSQLKQIKSSPLCSVGQHNIGFVHFEWIHAIMVVTRMHRNQICNWRQTATDIHCLIIRLGITNWK
jgi:hypothetical protein